MLNVDSKELFIFSLYFDLSNISLFATDMALFSSDASKGESSQHKQFPCNRKLLIYVLSNLSVTFAVLLRLKAQLFI